MQAAETVVVGDGVQQPDGLLVVHAVEVLVDEVLIEGFMSFPDKPSVPAVLVMPLGSPVEVL